MMTSGPSGATATLAATGISGAGVGSDTDVAVVGDKVPGVDASLADTGGIEIGVCLTACAAAWCGVIPGKDGSGTGVVDIFPFGAGAVLAADGVFTPFAEGLAWKVGAAGVAAGVPGDILVMLLRCDAVFFAVLLGGGTGADVDGPEGPMAARKFAGRGTGDSFGGA